MHITHFIISHQSKVSSIEINSTVLQLFPVASIYAQ